MNIRELAAMRRETIMQLHQNGFSSYQIAKQVAMDPSNVRKVIHAHEGAPEKAGAVRNKNRSYDHELKQKAVELHIFEQKTLREICKAYGIHSETILNTWCCQARRNNGYVPAPRLRGRAKGSPGNIQRTEKSPTENRVLELEKAIKYLEMENTLLKKFHQILRGW
jgi:transposase-like protein